MATKHDVVAAIAEFFQLPIDEVRPNAHFVANFGANSLDIVNLIWHIEEKFSLPEASESELEDLDSVQGLVDLVLSKLEAGKQIQRPAGMRAFAIASDHAGVELKSKLISFLRGKSFRVKDLGPNSTNAVDYPKYAEAVGNEVADEKVDFGILICGTGVGMSIAANKVKGIRAALCGDPLSAKLTRLHNDANILCLGARIIGSELALACVDAFISTEYDPGEDGRHQRRVNLITALEVLSSS